MEKLHNIFVTSREKNVEVAWLPPLKSQ